MRSALLRSHLPMLVIFATCPKFILSRAVLHRDRGVRQCRTVDYCVAIRVLFEIEWRIVFVDWKCAHMFADRFLIFGWIISCESEFVQHPCKHPHPHYGLYALCPKWSFFLFSSRFLSFLLFSSRFLSIHFLVVLGSWIIQLVIVISVVSTRLKPFLFQYTRRFSTTVAADEFQSNRTPPRRAMDNYICVDPLSSRPIDCWKKYQRQGRVSEPAKTLRLVSDAGCFRTGWDMDLTMETYTRTMPQLQSEPKGTRSRVICADCRLDTPVFDNKVRFVCISDTHERLDEVSQSSVSGKDSKKSFRWSCSRGKETAN